jgi:GTPase
VRHHPHTPEGEKECSFTTTVLFFFCSKKCLLRTESQEVRVARHEVLFFEVFYKIGTPSSTNHILLYTVAMAFIDEKTLQARAGDGGNGVVRWRHMKGKDHGGPSGGNGGRGGDVCVRAVRNAHLLAKYAHKNLFEAQRGEDGRGEEEEGANGENLIIDLPVGSLITRTGTSLTYSLDEVGQKETLLTGGRGGRGNASFKSSVNQTPTKATAGEPGEEATYHIEVQLIADMGFIGFPNAGKSSLLNELTNAGARVGAYPFTTLEPNLGECFGRIIADIPGLIEGASEGKGLGHTFLRHVRRTKLLVHLISCEEPDPLRAYTLMHKELANFDPALLDKPEIVLLTKTDLLTDTKHIEKLLHKLKKHIPTKDIYALTLYDNEQIKSIRETLLRVSDTLSSESRKMGENKD